MIQNTPSAQPKYYTSAINSKPAINFDGIDDRFLKELGFLSAPMSLYSINDFNSSDEQSVLTFGDANNTNTLSISRETDGRYFTFSKSAKYYGPALADTVNLIRASHSLVAPYHSVTLNGLTEISSDYALPPISTDGSLYVGSSFPSANYFNGNLSEIIVYNKALNMAQDIIVTNYLAAKYAIVLADNDKYNFELSHPYDVAGIGRVNASNIHSKAMSAGIISIAGATDLEDNEFVLFGHDNADIISWGDVDIPSGDVNVKRVAREWRLSITGGDGPGNVNISIDPDALPSLNLGFTAYNVLVDSDGDFSSGAVAYGLINSGDEFVANNVSISNGDYLCITAVKPSISFNLSESEGLESVERPHIEVSLNYPLSENASIEYRVSSGTALGGGVDYNLNQDVVNFVAGSKMMEIVPLIIEDDIVEIPDENFVVELFNPSTGISLGTNVFHTYTILDNDMELSITSTDTIIGACAESSTTITAVATGQAPFTYSWSPTDGLSNPTEAVTNANPVTTTKYILTASDALGKIMKDSINIEVVAAPTKPVITNSSALEFCDGGSVSLGTLAMDKYLWNTNDSLQNLLVSASGYFTLMVRDSFGCWSEISDTTEVIVNPLPAKPVVSNIDPLEFCEGNSVELSTSTMNGYLWSTTETTQNITVNTSNDYSVQVQDANLCWSESSDAVTVTVNPLPSKPVISYTGTLEFCEGDSLELSAPVMTEFLWSNGATSQKIYVKTAGSYSVQVKDVKGCWSEASAAVSITVNPLPGKPIISIIGALEFCEGGSVSLSTSAMTNYLWSNNETTQSILITSSDKISLKVQDNKSCWSVASDTTEVIVNPLPAKPVISNIDPLEFCEGNSVELSTASMNGYLWSTTETTQNITVNTSDDYSVQVQDANLCWSESSDAVSVTVNPLPSKPVITYTGTLEFCEGDSLELSAPAMTEYLWSNGATSQKIYVKTAGSYSVQVKDVKGCWSEASTAVSITVNPLPGKPIISIIGAIEFCEGGSVSLSTSAMTNYLWSNNETTQSILITSSDKISLKVQDNKSCWSVASDTTEVIVNPLPAKPVISNIDPLEFCEGNSVELSTSTMNGYLWSTTETTQNITVNTSDDYSVQVQDANLCWSESSDAVSVTVNPLPSKPVITYTGTLEFCDGNSLELSTAAMTNYLWSTGESSQSINANTGGNYTVMVKNSNDCWSESSDELTITVNPLPETPVIEPAGPHYLITGDSILLSTSSIGDSYLWSNGEVTQSVYIKESGFYSLVVKNLFDCLSQASADVEVIVSDFLPPPVIIVNGSTQLCEGESVELSVASAAGYLWSNGETSQTITVSEAGSVSVVVSDALGRTSLSSDPIEIIVLDNPTASFSTGNLSCYGSNDGSIVLESTSGADPVKIRWDGGETSFNRSNLAAGTYPGIITDNNECSASIEVQINEPDQIMGNEQISLPNCPDASDGEISMQITGGTQPYTYLWNTGDTGPDLYNLSPGSYSLSLTDMNNCEEEFSVNLAYQNPNCFIIPDIITPNGDGKNDDWIIEGLEFYPNVKVEIFDRWGKRVFYSLGYDSNWDGTFEGEDLPMESYHYVIDLKNGSPIIIGNITVVR